jgi:hypothetical protein
VFDLRQIGNKINENLVRAAPDFLPIAALLRGVQGGNFSYLRRIVLCDSASFSEPFSCFIKA